MFLKSGRAWGKAITDKKCCEEGVQDMCEILEKERAEGREEGEKRVNELNQILIKQGQFPGLIKAVEDTEYRNSLLVNF